MVTTFYPPFSFGGEGLYVQRLARALVQRGHMVDVIHDTDAFRMLSGTAPRTPFEDDGVRVHRMRSPHKVWSSLSVQQLGRPTTHKDRLEELLTGRYDVITYHNIGLIGGPGILPIGTGIKLFFAEDYWLVCPTYLLWKNDREICQSRACTRCQIRHQRPPQLWRWTDKLDRGLDHVDQFLIFSDSAAEEHRRHGFDREMTVIPPFIPEYPRPLKVAEASTRRRPYYLFVGELDRMYGLQELIPAMGRGIGADLLIAGTGQDEAMLRDMARGNPQIHFLGRKSHEDLQQLFRDAIATVIPTVWLDVFPDAIIESFREGTPIVAPNQGVFREVICKTGGGLTYSAPEDLTRILRQLADDKAEADALGRKAFVGFAHHWREETALDHFFGAIEDVARRKGLVDLAAKLAERRAQEEKSSA